MSKTEEESICRRTSFGPTFYSQHLYQSRPKRNLVKPAVFQSSTLGLTFLFLSDSPDLVDLVFLEAFTHRNSSTARAPPPPTHQLDLPWLSFEPSFCFWWLETLGPSEHAFSPVKTTTTHGKTLIWLEVSFNGLGPHNHQKHGSPTYSLLMSILKSCGPTSKVLKPIYMIINKVHQPCVQRFVTFIIQSNPTFYVSYSVLVGRRLHPSGVVSYLVWLACYQCRGLMVILAQAPSKGFSLLQNLDRLQFLIWLPFSRTVPEYSRKAYIGCARMGNAPFVTLVPSAPNCQLLPQGRRLGSDLNSQGQSGYKLCVEFLNLHGQRLHVREDPPALLRLVTHQMRFPVSSSSKATSTWQPSNPLVSSMEHTFKSSYASIVRAKYDHLLVRDFMKLVFKLESYKTSKDLPSLASSSRLCIFLEDSCSLYLYISCNHLLLSCKNIPLLRF